MKEFYKFCLLLLCFAGAYVKSTNVAAQCPVDRAVSPASVTICSGSTVNVTVTAAEANVGYQLQNSATNAPLSGFFLGTGANLTLTSNALSSSVNVKVVAINPFSFCSTDLTGHV